MNKHILMFLAIVLGAGLLYAQDQLELKGPYLGQVPPGDSSIVFAPDFISTDAGELNSVFCCDGNEFYFSRRGIPGKSSVLMMTKRIDDIWAEPEELHSTGIYSDIDLFITPNWKSLVFCSRRPYHDGDNEKPDHDFWIADRTKIPGLSPDLLLPKLCRSTRISFL